MILPDRQVRLSGSLLGAGAALLETMDSDYTVSELWDRARDRREIRTFGRFVDGLDLLFILGAVRLSGGRIVRERRRGGTGAAAR